MSKLLLFKTTVSLLALRIIPAAPLIAVLFGLVELTGGGLLVVNVHPRRIALGLGALVLVAAAIFHLPPSSSVPRALEIGLDAVALLALFAIIRMPEGTHSNCRHAAMLGHSRPE